MAGEIWRASAQIGKQSDPNISVPATRRIYVRDPILTKEADPRPHSFATGTRDNVRAFTKGPYRVGGSMVVPVSAAELVEPCLMTINGSTTPTAVPAATGAFSWLFKPGEVLDAVTLELNDGANDWEGVGIQGNSLNIAGSVMDENLATVDLFGRDRAIAAMVGGLAQRVPTFFEGWEVDLYIDAHGDEPGTTHITDTLISWDVTINNAMGRKYFGQNTKLARGITMGALEITASIVFEAASPTATAEMQHWEEDDLRLIRLSFGNNNDLGGGVMEAVHIDIPGAWQSHDASGEDEGTRTYEMELTYVYDPVLAAGVAIELVNMRGTAYGAA